MAARPLAGISLLVADDHTDSAELLEVLLANKGAEVRTANTASAALEVLESFKPSVLLLDISLPDMDGYELLREIRSLEGLGEVAAVAVTGHTSEDDRAKAEEAGFAGHTTKPIDIEALVRLVSELAPT
jgi:CheY-like chemotaxis protein